MKNQNILKLILVCWLTILLISGCKEIIAKKGSYHTDIQPPELRGGNYIEVQNITPTSLTLSWPAAVDNTTYHTDILYKAFYSRRDNIRTVKEIETNGTKLTEFMVFMTTYKVTGLKASNMYYFNILAKDRASAAGNKVVYGGVSIITASQ